MRSFYEARMRALDADGSPIRLPAKRSAHPSQLAQATGPVTDHITVRFEANDADDAARKLATGLMASYGEHLIWHQPSADDPTVVVFRTVIDLEGSPELAHARCYVSSEVLNHDIPRDALVEELASEIARLLVQRIEAVPVV